MEAWKATSTGLLEWARGPEPYKAINVYGEPFSGKSTLVLTTIMGGLPDKDSGIILYGTGSLIEAHRIAEMAEHAKRGMGLSVHVAVLKDPKEVASQTVSPGKLLLVMTHQTMRAILGSYVPSENTTIFLDQDPDASVEYVTSLISALSHTNNLSFVPVNEVNNPKITFRLVILSEEPLIDWEEGIINAFTATRNDMLMPRSDGRVFHATKLDKVQAPTINKLGIWENPEYASRDERIHFVRNALLSSGNALLSRGKAILLWVGHIRTVALMLKEFKGLKYTVTSTTDPDDFEKTFNGRDTTRNVVVMVDPNIRLSPKWLQTLGITHILCTGDKCSVVIADTFMRGLVEDSSDDAVLADWQAERMRRLSALAGILACNTHIEQPTGHDPQGKGKLLFCLRDLAAFLFRMVEQTERFDINWALHNFPPVPSGPRIINKMADHLVWTGIVEGNNPDQPLRVAGDRPLRVAASDRAKAFGELLADVENNFGAARILAGIKSKHAGAEDNLKTVLVSLAVIIAFQIEKPVELSPKALGMDMDALKNAFKDIGLANQPMKGLLWTILLVWQHYEKFQVLPPNSIIRGDAYVFEQMTKMRDRITKKLDMPTTPTPRIAAEDWKVIHQELFLSSLDRILWVDFKEGMHWPGTSSQEAGYGIRIYDIHGGKEVLPGPGCHLLDVRPLYAIRVNRYRGVWAVSHQPLIKTGDHYSVANLNYIPIDTMWRWRTHEVAQDQDDTERPTEEDVIFACTVRLMKARDG